MLTACVWSVCCLVLNMVRLSSWFLMAVLSGVTYFLSRKRFCPKPVKEVEEAPPPEEDKVSSLLREGREAAENMKTLQKTVRNPAVAEKVGEIASLTEQIFEDLVKDPADYEQVKRFSHYFLPTTEKLLSSYVQCEAQDEAGENIRAMKERIEGVLDATADAYRKQLDSLFANEALDVETDITVLETMLKREGLSGSDF